MRLPFGLDLKTIVVVLLVMYFVIPFATRFLASKQATKTS